MPPTKVTEFVPLPEHPPQVKVPEVLNVTGSALTSGVPSDETTRSNALMKVALKMPFMVAPICFLYAFALARRWHPNARWNTRPLLLLEQPLTHTLCP
jgi:hypothetical protein